MAKPKTAGPAPFSPDTQQSFIRYANETLRLLGKNYNYRSRMQDIDRAYQREQDFTQAQLRAAAANRMGDSSKMQNVTIPVVMPQVESALAELTNIFLSSYPLFPVIAKPAMEDAAMQMETVIGEQGLRFGWTAELMQVLRDGLKYNLMCCEVVWEDKKVASLVPEDLL